MGCGGSKKAVENSPPAKKDSDIDPDTGISYGELKSRFATKKIIFLLGGPGSGKGTQSERIINDFDTGYMSAGDLLRKEAASGSELGQFIDAQMKNGAILPQEITIRLLKQEILSQNKQLYLIDGFPRQIDQGETFERDICRAKCALFLEVPDQILIDRLLARAAGSGRADDNPETIAKRIRVFHDICELVAGYFDRTGRSVRIDGNRDPDVVYADVKAAIEKVIAEP
jgi:adenylate kinase family enzyme